MDLNKITIEVHNPIVGWTKIDPSNLLRGSLFRMSNYLGESILYGGRDRWVYIETRFSEATGKTVIEVLPYIRLVENEPK